MSELESNVFNTKFGDFIRSARIQQDILQKELAIKLNITPAYYCQIEKGQRNIDLELAIRICDCLGVKLNDFVKSYNADH